MKKHFYTLLAATGMLLATSCSHDDLANELGGESTIVTFKVNLPEETVSRATTSDFGKGESVNSLIFAMYEEDTKEALIVKDTYPGDTDQDDKIRQNKDGTFTVSVPMAKDIKYDLLFLAYNNKNCPFTINQNPEITNLRALQFKTELTANVDAYDTFVGKLDSQGITKDGTTNVTLKRPLAQINAASSSQDLEDAGLLNATVTESEFRIYGVPSTYDVFGETTDGKIDVVFKKAPIPSDKKITTDGTEYSYLALAYVLAGETATSDASMHKAEFLFYRANGKQVSSLFFDDYFPIKRNHRTNVLGSLLTKVEKYSVDIQEGFEEVDNSADPDDAQQVTEYVITNETAWAEMVNTLKTDTQEKINIKLGGIANRSADDKVILAEAPAIIHANKTVIFDLNGYTLKHECEQTSAHSMITNNGNLTIIDNVGGGKISYTDTGNGGEYISNTITNYGTLTIESGIIENMSSATVGQNGYPYVIDNHSTSQNTTLNVKGGKLHSEGYSAIRAYANSSTYDNVVNIESGEIVGTIEFQKPNTNANKANLNISGGKISNNATDNALFIFGGGGDASQMNINITGGEFTGNITASSSKPIGENFNSKFITGGTFSTDPSAFVDEDYDAVKNGDVWTIQQKDPIVAKIGNTEYESLQAAIEAVQAGETIVLNRDITFKTGANASLNGISYTRDASFTLDLSGYTITSNLGNIALRFKIGDGNEVVNTNVKIEVKNGKIVSGANNWTAISAATADNSGNQLILNLNNLEVENYKAGDYAIKSWTGAVINANNVKVTSSYGGSYYAAGGEMVLDHCISVQTGLHTSPYMSMAIAVSTKGKMTVNSGNYSTIPAAATDANNQGTSHGSWCGGVMSSGGELVINGGTFTNDNYGDNASATYARECIMVDAGGKLTINGGTFNALNKIIYLINNIGNASLNPVAYVNGGNFSANPIDNGGYGDPILKEGKTPVEGANGRWTLEDAVMDEAGLKAAFEEGGNIVLGTNITLSEMLVLAEDKTATLDLNGYNISVVESTSKHIYAFNNKGVLIIKDSMGNGSIKARGIYNGYNGTDSNETVDGAKMTIENGKFIGMDSDGGAAVFNCAQLTINGGDFTGNVAAVNNRKKGNTEIINGTFHGGNNYVIQNNGGQLTIDNATVDSGFGAVGCYGGKTTINAGTYCPTGAAGKTCHVVYVSGSSDNVTIKGGTFKMNYPENSVPNSDSAVASYYKGTLLIEGGTFYSHFDNVSPVELSDGASITGGVYYIHSGAASDHTYITNYLAEGYILDNGIVTKDE